MQVATSLPIIYGKDSDFIDILLEGQQLAISALEAAGSDIPFMVSKAEALTRGVELCVQLKLAVPKKEGAVEPDEPVLLALPAPTPTKNVLPEKFPVSLCVNYDEIPAEVDDVAAVDGFNLDLEMLRAQSHPQFIKFKGWLMYKYNMDEDYEFGHPDNDNGEELKDFFQWLVESGHGKLAAAGSVASASLVPYLGNNIPDAPAAAPAGVDCAVAVATASVAEAEEASGTEDAADTNDAAAVKVHDVAPQQTSLTAAVESALGEPDNAGASAAAPAINEEEGRLFAKCCDTEAVNIYLH